MNVGFVTLISRSSRNLNEGGSTCSFDDGRPSFPNDIRGMNFFFFLTPLLSKLLLFALLKLLSSALIEFSSTTLVLDLFIKSSANDTLGLGSRLADVVREFIDERSGLEFCLVKEM